MKWYRGVILFFAFVSYLLLGGMIFKALEAETIDVTKSTTFTVINQFQDMLLDEKTLREVGFKEFNWTSSVANFFDNFNKEYIANHTKGGWTFYDAVFFSLTVITTIGYGNLTVTNDGGRGFCIVYALIGIPITYLWMSFVGDVFRKRVDKTLKNKSLGRFNFITKITTVLVPGIVIFFVLPAAVFMTVEKWSFLDSIYYATITLSTIGFGDFVAGFGDYKQFSWFYKTCVMVWIVFGLGYLSMIFNLIICGMKSKKMKKMEAIFANLRSTEQAFKTEVNYIVQNINKLHSNNVSVENLSPIEKSASYSSENKIFESGAEATANKIDDSPHNVQQASNFLFNMALAMATEEKKRHPEPSTRQSDTVGQIRQMISGNLLTQQRTDGSSNGTPPAPTSTPTPSLASRFRVKSRVNRVHSVF